MEGHSHASRHDKRSCLYVKGPNLRNYDARRERRSFREAPVFIAQATLLWTVAPVPTRRKALGKALFAANIAKICIIVNLS